MIMAHLLNKIITRFSNSCLTKIGICSKDLVLNNGRRKQKTGLGIVLANTITKLKTSIDGFNIRPSRVENY
jgi:hypothetical protein